MSNFPLPDTVIIKVVGYLIGFIGAILVFCGGLIGYIFQSYKYQNGKEHKNLFDKADDYGERISKIEGKLKL